MPGQHGNARTMRTSLEIVVALLTSLLASGAAIAAVIAGGAALLAGLAWLILRRRSGPDGR